MAQYSVHVIIIMHPCHDQKEEGEKKVKVRDVNQWMVCDEGMKRLGIKFHGFSFACVSVAFSLICIPSTTILGSAMIGCSGTCTHLYIHQERY